jgi:hypothetical protein
MPADYQPAKRHYDQKLFLWMDLYFASEYNCFPIVALTPHPELPEGKTSV